MWSTVLRKYPDANGELNNTAKISDAKYYTIFDPQETALPGTATAADAQVESIPTELGVHKIDLSACDVPNAPTSDSQVIAGTAVASATIGTSKYELVCSPGNLASAPHFYLLDATTNPKKIIVR
jgi:hypothetical protein